MEVVKNLFSDIIDLLITNASDLMFGDLWDLLGFGHPSILN